MKINKLIWISALILIVSIPSAFAAIALFDNSWFIFAVNVFIIWIILFILQAYLLPEKLVAKAKVVIWIVVFVAAVLIAYFTAGGAGYIWQIGLIAPFLGWIAINTIIIAAVGYFGLGLLDAMPQKNEGKIGVALLIILFSGIIAFEIGDKFILHTDNAQALKDYLFAPEGKDSKTGLAKGGILRYEAPNYRLFTFIVSAMLFSWFFTAYLNLGNNSRLSYAMAIIIAANLASRGTQINAVIAVAEAFALLIVGKQIVSGGGLLGNWFGWVVTISLIEWIFYIVFGQCNLANLLAQTLGQIKIPIIGWSPFSWLAGTCAKIGAAATGIAPGAGIVPGATPTPTPIPTPSGGYNLWFWVKGVIGIILAALATILGRRRGWW